MGDFIKTILLLLFNTVLEFLPLSSTAHSILFSRLIPLEMDLKFILALSQIAIILVIMGYFWNEIYHLLRNFFSDRNSRYFCYNLCIATLPAIIFGLIAHGIIRKYFSSNRAIALFLMLGALPLLKFRKSPESDDQIDDQISNNQKKIKEGTNLKINQFLGIAPKTIYLIGLSQALSLIPGVSRSAITIVTAMMLGLPQDLAVNFSFFLSIPVGLAGAGFDILSFAGSSTNFILPCDYKLILLYFVINIIFALFFIDKILGLVKKSRLDMFGYYRIVFGILILVFF